MEGGAAQRDLGAAVGTEVGECDGARADVVEAAAQRGRVEDSHCLPHSSRLWQGFPHRQQQLSRHRGSLVAGGVVQAFDAELQRESSVAAYNLVGGVARSELGTAEADVNGPGAALRGVKASEPQLKSAIERAGIGGIEAEPN